MKTIHIHLHDAGTKDASFPSSVKYKGITFVPTGKQGTNRATGLEAREYAPADMRIWVLSNGQIEPE
jgi:hypothetical protein